MSATTLEEIKALHSQLAEKISAFEQQQVEASALFFPEATINLKPGEHYAGVVLGNDGEQSYYLILLPGEAESINWKDAKGWAAGQGGELPTRREQSLLFANLKEEFKAEWYWSAQEHESDSGYAWGQDFRDGSQDDCHEDYELRARAVRRLVIE